MAREATRQLTRQQVDAAAARRHVDVRRHLAVLQRDLQRAVVQVAEEEEAVRVPRAELEAQRYDVVSGAARQLQEAGGVEEDREGVGLHAGEGQVALREREEGEGGGRGDERTASLSASDARFHAFAC